MSSFIKILCLVILVFVFSNFNIMNASAQEANTDPKDVKVGVIKNSSLIKVEINGKAEVIDIKELYTLLGINKLNRTYRTITSTENIKIKQGIRSIDGNALVVVVSGSEGIILVFIDMNNLENYFYTGMKQSIVRKGEKENLYHSQDDGIQRPDIVTILKEGVAWVSKESDDVYNLNYLPYIFPKLVTTSFEGKTSTEKYDITSNEGVLSIVDGNKVLVSAKLFDNFGEEALYYKSLVKWSGQPRTEKNLNFNIVEDSRSMAGKDIVLEFSSENMSSVFNFPSTLSGWESTEIARTLKPIFRGTTEYLPYTVITRYGIGIVEVPIEDGDIRVYKMGDKPYNSLDKDKTGYFKPLLISDADNTIFGYIESSTTESGKNYLSLFSPEYRFGIKVELRDKVKPDYFLSASKERVILKEGNSNINSSIGIERAVFFAKTN